MARLPVPMSTGEESGMCDLGESRRGPGRRLAEALCPLVIGRDWEILGWHRAPAGTRYLSNNQPIAFGWHLRDRKTGQEQFVGPHELRSYCHLEPPARC